jgi:hypothetical protein
MIALVDGNYRKVIAKAASDRLPVIRRAEQAVQDIKRITLAAGLEMQIHSD